MSKQPPTAPTARAIGPCPTVIQNVGRPGTGSLPRTIASPDHPLERHKVINPAPVGFTKKARVSDHIFVL